MSSGEKEFQSTIYALGGAAFEFQEITETDFASAAGAAYVPPELGVYRRNDVSRTIQLLKNICGSVKTSQTSLAYLRLPCGLIATDDALNGRIIYIKNAGTSKLTIQKYDGTNLVSILPNKIIIAEHEDNDNWNIIQVPLKDLDFTQITKEPTGFLDRTESSMSFTNLSRIFTISPVSSQFTYYIRGNEYIKTALESVTITDNEGMWYIYYNGSALTASQTPWTFDAEIAFVAYIYWDAVNNIAIIFGEERHGLVMDWATHEYLHNTLRTQIEKNSFAAGNYILDGDGSLNTHAQISLTNGIIHDEDIIMSVTNSATPTLPFQQTLSTIAKIPLYYRTGTQATPLWRKVTATNYPIYGNSPNAAYYNLLTGGNWTLATATNDYYIVTWILATNNIYEPIIAIIGDNQQGTLIDASKNNVLSQIDIPNLPFVKECKFLYRLIFQTSSAYTNTPKSALRAIASDVSDTVVATEGVTPPFVFSKDGSASVGTYLRTGSVQTSRTGQIIKGTNYAVEIHISAQSTVSSITRVQFQRRTAVATRSDIAGLYVDLPSGQYRAVRTGLQILVGPDWELCCYNKSGDSLADPVVIIYFLPAG